jgi:sec-independent protein translocase protein TatB
MAEVTDAVHGRDSDSAAPSSTGRVDMTKKPETRAADERPPFDADAT